MIIGRYLDEEDFDNFFNDHYDNASAEKTKQLWQRLESDKEKLEAVKQEVADEFHKLIRQTNPDLVVISQYESYFFKSNNLTAPDKHAFDVLQQIKARYPKSSPNIRLEQYVEDPNKWLILEKPSQKQ
jgi:DNA-binding NarL/FixJ family response regulator